MNADDSMFALRMNTNEFMFALEMKTWVKQTGSLPRARVYPSPVDFSMPSTARAGSCRKSKGYGRDEAE